MFDWVLQNQGAATLFFTGVVAISTVIYAVLTAFLVFETRKMRRAQTEPRLTAYFEPIEELVNFGHLYIKNIGLGPAFNISFELTSEGSDSGGADLIKDFYSTKFFDTGVKYLGPDQALRSGYTSFTDNFEEKLKATIVVKICYRNSTNAKHEELYRIDLSELEGSGRLGKPHLYSIAQSLEKIQKDVGHLASGFSKLKVHVYNNDDKQRERIELEQRFSGSKNNNDEKSA